MNIRVPLQKLALIAGPTASGKSALALAVAERIGGTIINADASQVYRDLRILSARPTIEDEARAPHRLFGYRDGAFACTAADWAADARAAITETQAEGRVPILVGGTGLYIRTLIDGIAPIPEIDPDIRKAVRAMPVAAAHAALTQEDPAAAIRLRASDTTRVARALEVRRSTGRTLASWQTALGGGIGDTIDLVPLLLVPPRDWLRGRIAERFDAMIAGGAIDEVAALLARGLDPALPVMRAIGVAEIASMLGGALARDQAIIAATQASQRYAKRQRTWFTHQPPAWWPRQEQINVAMIDYFVTRLRL